MDILGSSYRFEALGAGPSSIFGEGEGVTADVVKGGDSGSGTGGSGDFSQPIRSVANRMIAMRFMV